MATENSLRVIKFLQENPNVTLTAQDIATAVGVSVQAVTGSVNGLVKKGFALREETTVQDGEKTKTIKLIRLTPEGLTYDPAKEDAEKAAAKAAKKEAAKATE